MLQPDPASFQGEEERVKEMYWSVLPHGSEGKSLSSGKKGNTVIVKETWERAPEAELPGFLVQGKEV